MTTSPVKYVALSTGENSDANTWFNATFLASCGSCPDSLIIVNGNPNVNNDMIDAYLDCIPQSVKTFSETIEDHFSIGCVNAPSDPNFRKIYDCILKTGNIFVIYFANQKVYQSLISIFEEAETRQSSIISKVQADDNCIHLFNRKPNALESRILFEY